MERRKSFLEDISEEKPESFQEEIFVPARRSPGRFIAAAVAILLVFAIALLFVQLNGVIVPDMSAWQLEDVQAWSSREHDNTVLNGIYNMEIAADHIISQDIEPGEKIGKSKVLTVTYSLGADPEETIALPDIKNMKLSELKAWIADNQMAGITVKYETSGVIPKDEVINYEFIDGSAEVFLRKNRMVIYVSSGNEDLDGTVSMPDFYGKSKADVLQWEKDNQMDVTLHEVFNQDIEYGKIFDQNIKKDTKITRKDSVEISISRGKSIQVPDFTGMSRSEASELAALYGISVFFRLKVSKAEIDTVISQDLAAGMEIDQKQILTLQLAKEEGKVIVPDFTGLTGAEAKSLAGIYGIKVFLRGSDEAGEQGVIISQSIASGKKIDEDQMITLVLKGDKEVVIIPDFEGMSKSEAEVLAKNLNIPLSYYEIETTQASNQTVIGQNIKAKTQVDAGKTILLSVAVNSGIRAGKISEMTLDGAKAWAMQNGITLNIIDCYSRDYSAGRLYDQDCDAGDFIPSGKLLTVYHSLGLVMADNFIGKTKSEIIKWKNEVNQKGAGIRLTFIPDMDTTKAKGIITNQSILEELIDLDQVIWVWVSATDNGVLIKNFEGIAPEDFKLWCDINAVPYVINECYSDAYEEGMLYGQNYLDTYLPKGENLKINLSLGKVFVKDFSGMRKSEVIEWQKEVNKKGANIEIVFTEWYSFDIERGKIMNQTLRDQEVDLNSTITVTVSLGLGDW
jgi:beta-lactam-binding protein with PASTA domain